MRAASTSSTCGPDAGTVRELPCGGDATTRAGTPALCRSYPEASTVTSDRAMRLFGPRHRPALEIATYELSSIHKARTDADAVIRPQSVNVFRMRTIKLIGESRLERMCRGGRKKPCAGCTSPNCLLLQFRRIILKQLAHGLRDVLLFLVRLRLWVERLRNCPAPDELPLVGIVHTEIELPHVNG